MTTTLTHQQQVCSDFLSTAIEGGINYWARGRKFVRATEGQLEGCYLSFELRSDATGEGDAFPKGDARNRWMPIDLDTMAKAIERILDASQPKLMRQDIIDDIQANWSDPDECRGDAETADCIVQVALFGEIVFG